MSTFQSLAKSLLQGVEFSGKKQLVRDAVQVSLELLKSVWHFLGQICLISCTVEEFIAQCLFSRASLICTPTSTTVLHWFCPQSSSPLKFILILYNVRPHF